MENIVVADKVTSQIDARAWGNLQLKDPAVVQMPVAPNQVASVTRNGQDLIVHLKNGEQIQVAHFFNTGPDGLASDMVFQDEDGALWQAQYSAESFNGFTFDEITSIDELIAGTGVVSGATSAWAIAGLGLLGAGGAAAAAGGGGGGGGGNGGSPGSPPDTTAPDAPTGLGFSANGLLLSGIGEVGAQVTVRDANGNVIGTGTVGNDGRFDVPLNAPQTNGQTVNVTLTDAAGNTSAPSTTTANDTTAPNAPANLQVSNDGTQLSGTAEPGATVQVRGADGTVLASGVAAADGTFNLTLSPPQSNGQTLSVSATDPAGNTSAPGIVIAADTTAPDAPTNLQVSNDGTQLSGAAEPGATVQVRGADGTVLASGVAAADGTFTLTLNPPQSDGQTLSISATDAAGNTSVSAQTQAPDVDQPGTPVDQTPPDAPTDVAIARDGTQISGRGEVGATATVIDANGNVLGTAVVGQDGTFTVTLTPPQTGGEVLQLTLTDAAGNVSTNVPVQAYDLSPPLTPTNLVLSADGLTLSGHTEAGARVYVRDIAGRVIGIGRAGADGNFTLTLDAAQINGQQLDVSALDAGGNTSASVVFTADDTQPPAPVTDLVISADGTRISGHGEPLATVTIVSQNGTPLGTVVVAANGTFETTLTTPVSAGDSVRVTQTDAHNNASSPVTVIAPATGPATPDNLALSADGTQLTGTASPNALVQVRDASGNLLGSAVADSNGTFSLTLSPAQLAGQVIDVVSTDGNGVSSVTIPFTTPDLTPPAEATDLTVSNSGLTLAGRGEAGATVTVTDAQGNVLGTAVVLVTGSFTVNLSTAQTNGQPLTVVLTDPAGNASAGAPVTAPDLDGPLQPENISVSSDGRVLTGDGEVGSRVTVTGANGTVLGSAIVGADGHFSLTLNTPQHNGQTLLVTAVDSAGNAAPAVSFITPDTQPPVAVSGLALNASGSVLTGLGEAGATVTVRDDQGNVIGSGQVGNNGQFSLTLDTPQTDAQVLQVTQADAAGNVSPPASVTAPDTSTPDPVTAVTVSANGLVVTGNGQVGATVTVTDSQGQVLGSSVVGANGQFEITLTAAQTNGQALSIVQADGSPTTAQPVTVPAPDLQAPAAPSALVLNGAGDTLSGSGEPGATVRVYGPGGALLNTAVVDNTGHFSVQLGAVFNDGQVLQVNQTDAANNLSANASLTAPDVTAPVALSNVTISSNGAVVTGIGTAGDTVTVRDASNTVLGSAVVAANGTFSVTLSAPQLDGQVLSVSQTDASNLSSPISPVTAPDVTAPPAPTGVTVDGTGSTVSGQAQAGSVVVVRGADGTALGQVTVGSSGTFTVTLNTPLHNGETLQVSATDGSNTSLPSTVTAPDDTPPAPVSNVAIDPQGTVVSGTGEPGTTVTISNGATVVGSGPVGADGTFVITLTPPAANGSTLTVTSSDATGNTSQPVPLAGPDGTQLATPSDLALSTDGLTLTGVGTPGSTVTVVGSNPAETATVNSFGRFSIRLNFARLNAETLHVTASDGAGHSSVVATVIANDTTAPDALTTATLNGTGSVVSGRGEAGATVSITNSAGVLLGTATVASNGTFSITLSTPQTNAQVLVATQTDAAGNVSQPLTLIAPDLLAPPAATGLSINAVGTVVSGQGEAGATVTIRDAAGNVLATGSVDLSGNFQVTLPAAQTTGAALQVTLTDASGNVSPTASLATTDSTPPAVVQVERVSGDGSAVSGTGEVGATVKVTDANGTVLGTAIVGADGHFIVALSPAQNNGQTLDISQTDASGNVSPSVNFPAPDISPPAALSQVTVNADGLTVTGHGEPGATVSVRSVDGVLLGTGLVASNGAFTLTLNTPQLNAQVLTVTQEDPPGNVSTAVTVVSVDLTPPEAPFALVLNGAGLQLTGSAEPGSTVTVRDASGSVIGTGNTAANGTFQITLSSAQVNGQTLSVVASDAAGNPSPAVSLVAADTTAPLAVSDLAITADGATLAGHGEAGATVVVRDGNGNLLGSGAVDANGQFSLALSPAVSAGVAVNVIQTDTAGNASPGVSVVAPGALAEPAPTNLSLSADGLTLAGNATAGSTVTVRNAAGVVLGTALVGSDGTFTAVLSSAQLNGEQVFATATSSDGINSIATDYVAADVTPPSALSDLVLTANGTTLTGRGEAGATVVVSGTGGVTLGTAVVGSNGTFSVTLTTAQIAGQTLHISQTDASGNESPSLDLTAPDRVAPDAPLALAVTRDGTLLSGTGEAGAVVNVYNTAGTLLGTGIVRIDGGFSITLTTPQANGQVLSVTLTDAAGNTSVAGNLTSVDTTAPAALTQLAISSDGQTLTGQGEAGATVTVTDSAGNVLGTATVNSTGTFTLVLGTPLTNAQPLTLTQTDVAGNVSPTATLNAPDTTAPDPLNNVAINGTGLVVTGSGEPGATVTVKDASGNLLGTTLVLGNGTFSVTLNAAQLNHQVLSVQQADPPGNISAPVNVVAPDLTPPAAATDLQFNAAGDVISGAGEVGATVSITLNGTEIATGTVDATGRFLINLPDRQHNGEQVNVVLSDAAGNASTAASVVAPDTTAPVPVAQLALDTGGLILSGTGEPGARLAITNASGVTLGTGTVDASGNFAVTLNAAQLNGQVLSVVQIDAAGNASSEATVIAADRTAPDRPVVTLLSADGLTLSGTGEAGATVTVTSANGGVLGTATVAVNGTFSVGLSSAQLNGEVLSLTQTDAATNRSDVLTYQVPDVTTPSALSGLAVSADGLTLTGNGEGGATVRVTDASGTVLGTSTVAANGTFSVTLSSARLNGESLTVVQTDAALHTSPTATVTAPDSTPPLIPFDVLLTGGLTLTGHAEAGSTVIVTSASGAELGRGVAIADGTFSLTLTSAQTNGELLSITATDAQANVSPVLTYTAPDTTDPDAVTGLALNAALTQLAGRGEVGATVVVSGSGGPLGSAIVGADGTFLITLTGTVAPNEQLRVIQTDASLNVSADAFLTVPTTPPPSAPVNLTLSADGLTLSGDAAASTTITVYGPGNALLGTATTDGTGHFSVTLNAAQTNGQSLQVTATASLGGVSLPATLVAADTTAPAALTDLAVNAAGTLVTGRGEVGATVTVNAPGGTVLGTALVGANGMFSLVLTTPQLNGQVLSAHQTDGANNVSATVTVPAPDVTPPAAPTALALNTAGLVLSGLGEAGATVTVRTAGGVSLGTAVVASNGTFSVALNAAQLNGQVLSVTQADLSGNVSAATGLTAADVTAPAPLSNLTLSGAGLLVSGTGEAGATVRITNASGTLLGTAVVNAAGTFTATLNSAQLNGQVLNVQQSDAAGNLSAVAQLTAGDVTAPTAPTALLLAANGITLSGVGEAGATVNVYGPNGALLGSTTIGVTGTFSLALNSAQLDGQALTVRLVDTAGNVSVAGTLTAPDTTPPAAPVGVAVSTTGTLVTGTGVAGATVSVRNAAGLLLGTATVAANGTFSVALTAAQINNEVLTVTQADGAGNVSVGATATAPDLTPPAAASTLVVSGDGLSLSGTGEAGSTVTVKSSAGVVLGTGVVGGTGVFSITLNAAQINGERLVVSLTDNRGNVSVGASVTAPDIDANAPVTASDNLAVATVNIAPAVTVQSYTDSFGSLLLGASKVYSFTVNAGTSVDPTLFLNSPSIVGVLTSLNYTLQVKSASGVWVTLGTGGNGGLLDVIGLAGIGVRVNLPDLLSGDYRLVVSNAGVDVLTAVNTRLELGITSLTQFNGTPGAVTTGNVITDVGTNGQVDQTGPDNGAVLQILKAGSYVAAGGGTTVQGLYGTLTIDASGHYTYTSNGSVGSVGKVDVFSYQLVHPNGLSATANIYVRIDSPQATEVWSDANLASPATLVDATNDIAHSAITLTNLVTTTQSSLGSFGVLLGGGSGTYTTSVAADTVSNLTVVLNASNLLSLLGSTTVGLYKLSTATGQYVLVKSYGGGSLLNLGGGNYGINFDGQTSGTYQVKVVVGGVGVLSTVNTSLINTATSTNQFVVGSYTPVSGNLLTDTAGGGVDMLGSPYTVLSVLVAGSYVTPGYNGTTITGTYGSLLVHADGSYTYTLNSGLTSAVVGHADVFTYQLTHPNGTTDTATLTIDLDPASAVASTSFSALSMSIAPTEDHGTALVAATTTSTETLHGSNGNDTLDGSHGGAITLEGGAGNDTLIIADQSFASVDGGTGTDTLLWAGGDATINLGDLHNRIHNIEILDLNHTSSVSLTLNLADVLAITSSDNDTLVIKGNSADSVHMTDRWLADGTHQLDGVDYTQYTPQEDPSHHLWVQNGVHVV
ncbi:Ig-like domain-containing protein [Pseudomonas sp. GD03842]|uniref:BapA/Bap/LapF family large adhesin n=1 Tax=Pseudomonas sp. GD03842 TaxID=2975385 RepID=UPI00244D5DDA|nr:BapA/Bap/LapF family large adhesin [Pseudomonas sp. GD03842]MDH0747150.1 Ig-like domain-containing protein [Pseudomonas sp. GD03842]